MNMMVHYESATSALATALKSTEVQVVLKSRDDLGLLRLRARQLRDRKLLADATEFQMRVERWLGELLRRAKSHGHLPKGRPKTPDSELPPATLTDIGVDRNLSMKAQRAAGLSQEAFDHAVAQMRERIAAGRPHSVHAINEVLRKAKRNEPARPDCFDFQLLDGTPLGKLALGKVQSRIERLNVELKILQAIDDRIGMAANIFATVKESVSQGVLEQIIEKNGGRVG